MIFVVAFLVLMVVAVVAGIVGLVVQEGGRRQADHETLIDLACPTCGRRRYVWRVTAGQRIASGLMGGLLFSRKARAQFECRKCGYFW